MQPLVSLLQTLLAVQSQEHRVPLRLHSKTIEEEHEVHWAA